MTDRGDGSRGNRYFALLVLTLVLAGGLLFILLDPQSVIGPVTKTSTLTISPPVKPVVYEWAYGLESRNVTSLAGMYAPNATIVWTGNILGLAGIYNGQENIRILYGATLGKDTAFTASIANYSQTTVSPIAENVTFSLTAEGNSTVYGSFNFTAKLTQGWNFAGGQWQVLKENWNYTTYNEQFARFGTTTTFPQWAVQEEGGNPNLVSEKSFEWHAGPFVAASVYACLSAVMFAFALRFFKERRENGITETRTTEVKETITWRIRRLDRVRSTLTMIVVEG